jgi:hypothetical protein
MKGGDGETERSILDNIFDIDFIEDEKPDHLK